MIIRYEPAKKDFIIQAIPVEADRKTLSEHFGEAPYFCLVRTSTLGKGILDIQFLPNPHLHEEKGKGIKTSEWLLEKGVDRVYTRKPFEGKGPSYVFASAEVEVRVTDARTVEEINSEFTTRPHL